MSIYDLVDRAGFDWSRLDGYIQEDLTDDWNNTTINDVDAIPRIRKLLLDVAPEASIEKEEDDETR